MRPLLLLAPATLLAFAHPLSAQSVWVVDVDAGPGHDFTDLQPAIDAAADGDILVVRETLLGEYGPATLDGKGLTLAREDALGERVELPALLVRNLTADQEVSVRGLRVVRPVVQANAGIVAFEDCTLGREHLGFAFSPCGIALATFSTGLTVSDSEAVFVTRCEVGGGFDDQGEGLAGIEADGANLYLHETNVLGGFGNQLHPPPVQKGGPAVRVRDTFLYASGGWMRGGCGTQAYTCVSGGPGGDALVNETPALEPWLFDVELEAGIGGCSITIPCQDLCGADGETSATPYSSLAGEGRSYELMSPAVSGALTPMFYAGEPGDLVFGLFTLEPDALFLAELFGVVITPTPLVVVPHGTADAQGDLVSAIPLPVVQPGSEGGVFHAQAGVLSAAGQAFLGAPTTVVYLPL